MKAPLMASTESWALMSMPSFCALAIKATFSSTRRAISFSSLREALSWSRSAIAASLAAVMASSWDLRALLDSIALSRAFSVSWSVKMTFSSASYSAPSIMNFLPMVFSPARWRALSFSQKIRSKSELSPILKRTPSPARPSRTSAIWLQRIFFITSSYSTPCQLPLSL